MLRMNKIQMTGTLVMHGVLFIGLIIACVYQSKKCVDQYLMKETSVKLIVIDAMDMRFPAISVNAGFRRDVLSDMGLTEAEYLAGKGWHYMNMSADDVYKMVTRDIHDVLESITIIYNDGRVEVPDFFKKNNNKKLSWSDNRGKSHVFHYEIPATEVDIGKGQGVEWMFMKFKNNTDFEAMTISIQHAGRMLAPEIKDSTYKLARGVRTVATIRYSLILLLDQETYPCVGVPDDEKVEFDDCQQEHIQEELEHELNCRVPWVLNSALKVCDEKMAMKASELYFKAQMMPPCVQPCCTKEIDVNNKFFERTMDGNTEMELRFPPNVKFYVEQEVYGIVSMLAELSGYIGMFLGVSFFDLKILIDVLSDYAKNKKDMVQKIPTLTSVSPIMDVKG